MKLLMGPKISMRPKELGTQERKNDSTSVFPATSYLPFFILAEHLWLGLT
jgi:hypothetical protein